MNFDAHLSDEAFLKLLGERLTAIRLSRNLSQQQLADEAGLGLRTIQRLEQGAGSAQLTGFVHVCRVLGLMERFDILLPESSVSPIENLNAQRRKRQRASNTKIAAKENKKWEWGEP